MISPVKIFTAAQIRETDAYTIKHEPVASVDLMERAAMACTQWIVRTYAKGVRVNIVCGMGNNGGDGLAIARQLQEKGYTVEASVLKLSQSGSQDFQQNLQRLHEKQVAVQEVLSAEIFLNGVKPDLVIDAVFGTGLNKPVTGLAADCINKINAMDCDVVSIDLPSGLFADAHTPKEGAIVKARYTLTFQMPKFAFMFAENAEYVGEWVVLDIGLNKEFIQRQEAKDFLLTKEYIKQLLKPRPKFSHKGTYGHGLMVTGSFGKMGASVLSAKGFLHSGAGLLTVAVPQCGYEIMQTTVPEAMTITSGQNFITTIAFDSEKFKVVGIGPGLDTQHETRQALRNILQNFKKPMVLDADALNILALNPDWIKLIPANSVLTPHPGEFERLVGTSDNDFERHKLQLKFSEENNVFIVLKGAHTCITTPDGLSYFNTTGNSGLAKGGSGDLLTGIITGILAQSYTAQEAALIGVFIHGLSADIAKEIYGERAMLPSDIIELISKAWLQLS